jgi:hypothetical protein
VNHKIPVDLASVVATLVLLAPGPLLAEATAAGDTVPVTVQSFQRAESDMYFGNTLKRAGGVGKFLHYRTPTPIDAQEIVRMNRDTLYSAAVFDLDAGPVTITLPDPGKRFMSLQVISGDHYSPPASYAPTTVTLTREKVGTRYAMTAVRTFADPTSQADLQAVNALQDQIKVEQPGGPGTFEVPNWDPATQGKIRGDLADLQSMSDCTGRVVMGMPAQVDPVCHLMATATGWGLNPREDAVYDGRFPSPNTGQEVMKLTVKDVPVDGFWSLSIYDAKGFFAKNELDSYSINNVTAKPNADGSYTIQFGGCTRDTVNCLVTPAGWNYVVRMYRPRQAILDGSWKFPQPTPVE